VRRRTPIALVLLLALAAGCDSSSKARHGESTVETVPWTAAKPPEVAARTPAAAPCRPSALAVKRQVKFVPRLNGGIALVQVTNTGKHPCRLTGRPSVRLVKQGGPKQIQKAIPTTPSQFPDVTYPESALLALRPGEAGDVTITWDNWCDPAIPGKPHLPPSALRITLPGGRGSVDADYNAVPPCLDLNAPSTIGVSRFQPNLFPPGRAWTDAFIEASVPGQPVHARRGAILRFRVVLKNASHTPARFDRCPAYIEQLVPNGSIEAYELNCRAAGSIAPGKSVAFAMQVRVPKSAPLGGNGLFWELDPFGARIPSVHARVTIDP
jgi:hypothetical protein